MNIDQLQVYVSLFQGDQGEVKTEVVPVPVVQEVVLQTGSCPCFHLMLVTSSQIFCMFMLCESIQFC